MTTLAVSAARTFGPQLLRTGLTLAANTAISNFLAPDVEGPRQDTFKILTSRDGAPMPRVWGRTRLGGQVIWASRIRETSSKARAGGKGGPSVTSYSYSISFAVGLCEGMILDVPRIWANGAPLTLKDFTWRLHRGGADQMPDPVIEAIEGADVPAFRGTAYVVFEDFSLDEYGGRLPQINAEVIRVPPSTDDAPRLESMVRAVNLIPASGEFAYATSLIEATSGPGRGQPLNMNNLDGRADVEVALDQMQAQLPNVASVAIVSSWFGTDLRVGSCEIKPGVEDGLKIVEGGRWRVGGMKRRDAHAISGGPEAPNYGGTPSDDSMLELIASLKRRGLAVSVYPFILMDVPPGNGLPDPSNDLGSGAEQGGFPWRGRITGPASDVSAFFGSAKASDWDGINYEGDADDYGFRRFILHHAALARAAGGVERFIIGSEMRGLTTIDDGSRSYPAVAQLISLATEVRKMLPGAQLSYAADWSEYFGHQDGADLHHHLDPLWADPNIAAIAIDAYFPLADWRDGAHLDSALSLTGHDVDYLSANMEGGEGYDWYYASPADRDAQIRTPITDPRYRYKDVRSFWSSAHVNSDGSATPWVPRSKPIWFTEIGCPAADRGANQPNVFYDPKSSESFLPHYSGGTRDDLIQRRYLEAFIGYWNTHNEPGLIDTAATHVWTWDARPYPDFPARTDVWTDGPNWRLGHWLNGRMGLVPLGDILTDLVLAAGLPAPDVSGASGLVEGFALDRPGTVRSALEALVAAYRLDVIEGAERLVFTNAAPGGARALTDDWRADGAIEILTGDPLARPGDLRLHFVDPTRDYQAGSVAARDRVSANVIDVPTPIVMAPALARQVADGLMADAARQIRSLQFAAPRSAGVGPGDILEYDGDIWTVGSVEGGVRVEISARPSSILRGGLLGGSTPDTAPPTAYAPAPAIFAFNLPDRAGLAVGAMQSPFGGVRVTGGDAEVVLREAVSVGALLGPLPRGPVTVWDDVNAFRIFMPGVQLAGMSDADVRAGANRFAVETPTGWEILGVAELTLDGPNRYTGRRLLRGLHGSDSGMADLDAGARVIWLDEGVQSLPLGPEWMDADIRLSGQGARRAAADVMAWFTDVHARPLAPVHGRIVAGRLSFIRRTRVGGDNWAAPDVPLGEAREAYRLRAVSGDAELSSREIVTTDVELTDVERSADRLEIAQLSETYGAGPALVVRPAT